VRAVPGRVNQGPRARRGRSELDKAEKARILQLEEAMRKTSICGLGQVALGPVVSVLGLDKGGAAAREQPKPDGAAGQPAREHVSRRSRRPGIAAPVASCAAFG
jgi:hypothetical protein